MLIIEKLKTMQKFGTKLYENSKIIAPPNTENHEKIKVEFYQ